ncbi:zinc finger CCHC domain-containing protein 4-like [Notothenia coriiceps]|uniref:Zinc finger CCHC domain-containing protein 4-like n=1 Tax=Notothenia coriiceps TaxID=8208 RepID=A0A6I9NVD5_9TELE|nr:PREDICTED: zinc finger CCHC domain-containing protein 4-like [Notothenia coriiceps]
MFNHHFFDGKASSAVLQAFLTESEGGKLVMVADPPFGGLVKPLANSFSLLSQTWRKLQSSDGSGADMPMMWIFPYFFEPRILECLPSLTMLDYQVIPFMMM